MGRRTAALASTLPACLAAPATLFHIILPSPKMFSHLGAGTWYQPNTFLGLLNYIKIESEVGTTLLKHCPLQSQNETVLHTAVWV